MNTHTAATSKGQAAHTHNNATCHTQGTQTTCCTRQIHPKQHQSDRKAKASTTNLRDFPPKIAGQQQHSGKTRGKSNLGRTQQPYPLKPIKSAHAIRSSQSNPPLPPKKRLPRPIGAVGRFLPSVLPCFPRFRCVYRVFI